jgi:hypothetical protein
MDDSVRQAMIKWPKVPAMYGWLRLDRRGHWFLIDRAHPGFDETRDGAGSVITNAGIIEFIARNYAGDESGRWYWQNGPQRVYVDLDLAPLVIRVFAGDRGATLVSHCGAQVSRVESAYFSDDGNLLLSTDLGPGHVHDLDLAQLDIEFDERSDLPQILNFAGRRIPIAPLCGGALPWANYVSKPRAG